MSTHIPGQSLSASAPSVSGRASLAILALAIGWGVPAFSQTKPNWGDPGSQTRPGVSGTTNTSPWGATRPPAPIPSRSSGQVGVKTDMPPALAELLKRPDTDVISLSNGKSTTVRQIRAEVNTHQAVVQALKTGEVPAGRKRVRVAVSRSPQHDELLNASKLIRDTARREAGFTPATPAAGSEPHAGSAPSSPWSASLTPPQTRERGQDPGAAWAATGGIRRNTRLTQPLAAAPGVPVAATTELHSGIGSASMQKSVESSLQPKKPTLSGISQQPAQIAVAESTPDGIALVNGHSKGVQFTPGGLYTIIGSGFGGTLGTVDLIGPHLPGGRLGLPVTQWNDRQLQAQLPEPVSGIADQSVTLRVTTRTGTLFTKDVQFYATRQPVTLSGTGLDLVQAFDLNLGAPNDWTETLTNSGNITRTKSGNNIDCPSIGKDTLRTKFPPGWALVEVAVNSWLPTQSNSGKDFFGQDGDTVVSGNYSITQIPAGLINQTFEVHWGVLRSHSTNGLSLIPTFNGNDFGWSGNDGCVSSYEVEVTLVGPAGLHPF